MPIRGTPQIHTALAMMLWTLSLHAAPAPELTVRRIYTDADRTTASACVEFSDRLDEDRSYDAAIDVTPPGDYAFTRRYRDELCIEGLPFGHAVTLTVNAGLESTNGHTLRAPVSETVQMPDRPAWLRFDGSRYILPATDLAEIPLTVVNTPEVVLRLYHITDRNLVQTLREYGLTHDLDGWRLDDVEETLGTLIWNAQRTVDAPANREHTVPVALDWGTLPATGPGVYALVAGYPDIDGELYPTATQWIVRSDIGLSAYLGETSTYVMCRSLADGQPKAARLVLLSAVNAVLGEAACGADGHARFPSTLLNGEGSRTAVALSAFTDEGDFNLLDLRGEPFDLTDRGVHGRAAPGPLDAALFPDRGIYRPGESIELLTLLRDSQGQAVEGLPLTLTLIRPDQQVFDVQTATNAQAGGHHLRFALPENAPTGQWRLDASVDGHTVIGRRTLHVEDFMPPRLDVRLAGTQTSLRAGDTVELTLGARFYSGASAAGAVADVHAHLRRAPTPHFGWAGFQFGLEDDELAARQLIEQQVQLNDHGEATVAFPMEALPEDTGPLALEVRATVFEPGGRPVEARHTVAVHRHDGYLGIRPLAPEGRFEDGQPVAMELIRLDTQGQLTAGSPVHYRIVEEVARSVWFTDDWDRWRYRWDYHDGADIATGTIELAGPGPTRLELNTVPGGRYRLEAASDDGLFASHRFSVGWWGAPPSPERPDVLRIALDRADYRHGDVARVRIDGDYPGQAQAMVAAGDVLWSATATLDAHGNGVIDIPIDHAWGPGAYVLVSAYRDTAQAPGRGPSRAIGVAPLVLDHPGRTLEVTLSAPDTAKPDQPLTVDIAVDGVTDGAPVYALLYAVDEGILDLTGFASPDPAGHFFGARALGTRILDHYGRILPIGPEAGPERVGGDGRLRQLVGGQAPSEQSLALTTGIVRLGDDRRYQATLPMPALDGAVRLMAIAWSDTQLGSADRDLTLAEAISAQLYRPRFLRVGDTSQASATIHIANPIEGAYRVRLEQTDGLAADPVDWTIHARAGQAVAETVTAELTAVAAGAGAMTLTVTPPVGDRVVRRWRLPIAASELPVQSRISGALAPGGRLGWHDLAAQTAGRIDGVHLSVDARAPLHSNALTADLIAYPYACAEQTASRLWALTLDAPAGAPLADKLRRHIQHLLTLQRADGAFGLWSAHDTADLWLTAYAVDVLAHVNRADDEAVPDAPLQRALRWLDREADPPYWDTVQESDLTGPVYANAVLARHGRGRLGVVRDLFANAQTAASSPLTFALLGSAFEHLGDREHAERAFARALAGMNAAPAAGATPFGDARRDRIAALAVALADNPARPGWDALIAPLGEALAGHRKPSTQEAAWLLRLANTLQGQASPHLNARLLGEPVDAPDGHLNTHLDSPRADGAVLENTGDAPMWYSASITHALAGEARLETPGLEITRQRFTLDGTPLGRRPIDARERLVVVLEGVRSAAMDDDVVIVDRLPAGLEIDNPRIAGNDPLATLDWLGALTDTGHVELRDDRFVATLEAAHGDGHFRLAYIARAVTPGRFAAPAPFAEAMYRPWLRASGTHEAIEVTGS